MAVDEHAELDDPLDPVERAQRGLDLGQQHDAAAARRGLPGFEIEALAQPALDQAAVLGELNLPADMQQAIGLDRGDIAGHRGGRLREG